MANMPDEIVLARMMTALDLEFERALHYHNEGYESDKDYVLPPCITRPVCAYSVFSAEASFNPTNYTTAKSQLSPFTETSQRPAILRRGLLYLTFDETPSPAMAVDPEDKEDLPVAKLDNPMWDEEQVLGSREYLYIHEIPRLATPPHTHSPYQQPHPHSLAKDFQTHHLSMLTKWKCPQNWKWMYWMVSQT